MNKTKYELRHLSCNMDDFDFDRHRFKFKYNKKEYTASCYRSLEVFFDDKAEEEIPEEILCEVQALIWDKIDSEEKRWKYPKEAYEIANEYCKENFK